MTDAACDGEGAPDNNSFMRMLEGHPLSLHVILLDMERQFSGSSLRAASKIFINLAVIEIIFFSF